MRILITGVTGFIGGHLVERLARTGGHELFGVSRKDSLSFDAAHLAGRVTPCAAELADTPRLESLLRDIRPDWLFHLAGYANPRVETEEQKRRCWEDNLGATESLYAAVERSGCRPRILFASTGHVYGLPDRPGQTCTEDSPLNPRGAYAESKLKAEVLCEAKAREGLDIVRVRLFNQIGPRQSRGFIVPDYASQIAEFEAGLRPSVRVGDLSAWRDFTDVRDIVVALESLMNPALDVRGRVFNAASGRIWQLQQLFDLLRERANGTLALESSESILASPSHSFERIDATALRVATGWLPQIDMDQTIRDTLDYWRSKVSKSAIAVKPL